MGMHQKPLRLWPLIMALMLCALTVISWTAWEKQSLAVEPVSGGGYRSSLFDLEGQLAEQFREAWPEVKRVEITHFERPDIAGRIIAGIRIRWDERTSTATAITLYEATDGYLVGTVRLDQKKLPANVLLSFK